ncbi:MAG: hypothetical protein RML72_00330 [Bacteroidia bacterium]|nr:hypothetical protein [Bacteroidia bacterium]MDW8157315.1 hypothetical protein [Bacteroidia bacterium]
MNSLRQVIIGLIVFIFLQKIVFQSPVVVISELATPKVFLVYLLMLSYHFSLTVVFLLAFAVGLIIDFLVFPIGAHAFSSLLIVALRGFWVKLISPQIVINPTEVIEPAQQSLRWQMIYIFPLALIYEIVYNVLADFDFSFFTLQKIFFSWAYTCFWSILFTILFFRKSAA